MASRSSVKIPFLDQAPLGELLGSKLPTGMSVFRHFWEHFKVQGKPVAVAARETAKSVASFWSNAGLKTKHIDYIVKDVRKWYTDHQVNYD